jgi:glycine dehydrogenase subunit 1
MMDFIPNTEKDRELMLKDINVNKVSDLFKDIPASLLLKDNLKVPKALSEIEVKNLLIDISKKNKVDFSSFLGAGAYKHFIPSVVNHIVGRSEFYTAYTPYQPEISQGMLQVIYEYQTMICDLTGMDVANASMYDGASALAESCIMATNITRRKQILMLKSIHPEYRQVVKTYCDAHNFELVEISVGEISEKLCDKTAALLIQNPDFFGSIYDLSSVEKVVHDNGALLVVSVVESTSLGLLKKPGDLGADIVVGEGQSFGNPVNFGGPYLGIMATKDKYKRSIPGRLVGATVDSEGERGFILTLQAREQHIRREKAPSNICSNEALCALAATVYLSTLGKEGIKELADLNIQKSHYLVDKLKENGFEIKFDKPFYNEFVVKVNDAKSVSSRLLDNKIIGGLDLGEYYPELSDCLLFCVTELNTIEEMDRLVEVMKG